MRPTFFLLVVLSCCLFSCSRKQDWDRDWIFLSGRYIGQEICEANPENNYHLIEIISPQQVGDSIIYQGSPYANVLKAKGVDTVYQKSGTLIGFDAKISSDRISSPSCDVNPSATYPLYEMTIIHQIPFR